MDAARHHRRVRPRTWRSDAGASLIEFALLAPVVMLLLIGIVEFGRLLATNQAVAAASREATRYGIATGIGPNGTQRYVDCAGIREAGKRSASIVDLTDGDIEVTYDRGPGTSEIASCPAGGSVVPATIVSGDRVRVTVRWTFRTSLPILKSALDGTTITSTDRRTVRK